jgi:hypothetical protein
MIEIKKKKNWKMDILDSNGVLQKYIFLNVWKKKNKHKSILKILIGFNEKF